MNAALALPLLLALAGAAFYSPRVAIALPAGGQRGTEVEVCLRGERLQEPLGLLGDTAGIEVLGLAAAKPEACTVRLRLAADCTLGAHLLRLRTSEGLSNAWQFRVGALPELAVAPATAPMPIPLDCTIDGELTTGRIDRFAVAVPAATTVHCEVEALRLGFAASDLALQVLGPDGTELASNDDSDLGGKDPRLSFATPAAGTCEVAVSFAFAGDQPRSVYRLHIGTFPRPLTTLPCGGQPGQPLECDLLGDGPPRRVRVTLPDVTTTAWPWFAEVDGRCAPTPILLRVGGPPNQDPTVDAKGRAFVTFPASVHGVLAEPGARALFWFHAQQGEVLQFRALARSLRSALDPVLIVREANGRYLASNDDQNGLGLDSQLRFQAAATGDFQVEVRDVLRSVSPCHVFRLEGERPLDAPSLRLSVARREDAMLEVPRGGAIGRTLQCTGVDLDLGLTLLARDLPTGVTAQFGAIQRGTNLVPMLLTADPQAPPGGSMVGFALHAEQVPTDRDPGYEQDLPLVTVRNDAPIVRATQRALPVAVIAAAPFAIDALPPAVPILRGAPMTLRLRVQRRDDNKDKIRVRALWTPPGINAGQCTIEANQSEGDLQLSADDGALLGTFPFAVIGSIARRDSRIDNASAFVPLTVDAPWVTARATAVRSEPDRAIELRVALTARRPFGAWQGRLVALPRGVVADAVDLAADATEAVFRLRIGADAPPGRHRGWRFEARIPHDGGVVVGRAAGGELRIDAPAPTPAPVPIDADAVRTPAGVHR